MDTVHRYLRLGLRFGRLEDGLIDSYVGPAEIAAAVSAGPAPTPPEVVREAGELHADLPDGWLRDQVGAIRTYAGVLAGETLSFEDEARGCYGADVTFTDESVFEAAHERLSDLLPGPQPLADRYRLWRERTHVPPDRIAAVVAEAVALGRAWTDRLVPLPDGEGLEIRLVQGRPWSGYHEYLGGFRGRISISTDAPRSLLGLVRLALHETYPGHQAEGALKERQGRLEETLTLGPVPQALISEGLAEVAPELVLDSPEAAVLGDLAHDRAVEEAAAPLRRAEVNAAMLAGGDERRAYLRRWRLIDGAAADQLVRFLERPASRTYVAVYPAGYALCRAFVRGDPRRFRRLLTDQIRVADLR